MRIMMSLFVWMLIPALSLLIGGCGGSSPEDDSSSGGGGAPKSYLVVTPTSKMLTNSDGHFYVIVNSNTKWCLSECPTWITPEKVDGNGSVSLRMTYSDNTTLAVRKGLVEFTAEGCPSVTLLVTQTEKTFTNPIGGVPDPWIVKQGANYYLCKAHGDGINISVSDRLSVLTSTTSVWKAPVDVGTVKPWNTSHIWAPELHYISGKWYIYYTAGRPRTEVGNYTTQRSGVLRAKTSDPKGGWEDLGMLYTGDEYEEGVVATVANTSYAIDLVPMEINGQHYAVWSGSPSKSNDSDQSIYIAQMSDQHTISSNRVKISRADKSWEQAGISRINEGPAILKRNGKVFIVYSCNGSWTKHYRLGYLMIDQTKDPMVASNWTKSSSAVFYRCDDTIDRDGVNGVGHCCFTTSPDGSQDWMVYHVKNRNDDTYESGRSTFIQPLLWTAQGMPDFGTPVGWGEAVLQPSGEN